MNTHSLKVVLRKETTKGDAKTNRRNNLIPCVLYGRNRENIHFLVQELALKPLIYTRDISFVELEIEGQDNVKAIVQDIQFHPITDRVIHIDFLELQDDVEITMDVPVNVVGRAAGVIRGGEMRLNMRKLRVKTLPASMPQAVEVDVTSVDIGDKIYVSALHNDQYKFSHPDNAVVAQVKMSRAAMGNIAREEQEDVTAEE